VTILVDAAPRGATPGTLSLIEPDLGPIAPTESAGIALDGHTLDPLRVLRLVQSLGGRFNRLLLVACEPAELGGDAGWLGLSAPVEAAVQEAIPLITGLVTDILAQWSVERETFSSSDRRATILSAVIFSSRRGGRTRLSILRSNATRE